MSLIIIEDEIGVATIGDRDEEVDSFVEEKIAALRLGRHFDLGQGMRTCRPKPENAHEDEEPAKRLHIRFEAKAAKRENKMNLRFRREI